MPEGGLLDVAAEVVDDLGVELDDIERVKHGDRVQMIMELRSKSKQPDRKLMHYPRGMVLYGHDANGRISRRMYTAAKGHGGVYGYICCAECRDGTCTLSHLPVATVEAAIERSYGSLDVGSGFPLR